MIVFYLKPDLRKAKVLFKRSHPLFTSLKNRKSNILFYWKISFHSNTRMADLWNLPIKACRESRKNYTFMVVYHQFENCKSWLINTYFKRSQKSCVHFFSLQRCHREVSLWVCNAPSLNPVVKWKL